jgi:hypothetical protein
MAPLAVAALAVMQTAVSAQTMTVQSLIDDGYTIVGVTAPPAGGGAVYLQKGKALVFCFVAEKPGSTALDTQYCKPVK